MSKHKRKPASSTCSEYLILAASARLIAENPQDIPASPVYGMFGNFSSLFRMIMGRNYEKSLAYLHP
jgi:hypothetical protein